MDWHLNRDVLVGSNGYEHLEPIVICQECDEKEKTSRHSMDLQEAINDFVNVVIHDITKKDNPIHKLSPCKNQIIEDGSEFIYKVKR